MYVTGRVVVDGGGAPPEQAAIERVCVGSREVKGYTDSKGRFSIDLKRSNRLVFDASATESEHQANSALKPGGLDGCELRAKLQGFRSDRIPLTGRRMLDHPDVGVIVLHRLEHVEGTTVSATWAMAPAPARKLYEKAQAEMKKGKNAEAEKYLAAAVGSYPKFATAWNQLGQLRLMRGDEAGAREAFALSIEADAKFVPPQLALARLAIARKQWNDAVRWSDQVLRLDRVSVPEAWLINAMGNLFGSNLEAAERSVVELLKMDGGSAQAEQVAGYVYSQRRNWPEAAIHLRKFIELAAPGPEQDLARRLLAQAEQNAPKTAQSLSK